MSVFALHFPWQLLRFIVRHDNRWCFSVFSEVMFVVVFYIEESENSKVKSSPLGQLFSNTSLHVLFLQNPVGLSRALREKKHKIVTSNILYGYFEKSSTFSRNFAGIAENPRYLPETIIKHACKPWFQVREDSKPLAGVLSRAPLCPGGRGAIIIISVLASARSSWISGRKGDDIVLEDWWVMMFLSFSFLFC